MGLIGVNIPDRRHIFALARTPAPVLTSARPWLSTDGGNSWDTLPLPYPDALHGANDVFFVDSLHGWITLWSNRIYRTSDGGHTWEFMSQLDGYNGGDMKWYDTLRGYVGQSWTTDGGRTWSAGTVATPYFISPTHGFAADDGYYLETHDGGHDWIQHPILGLPAGVIWNIFAIFFSDSLHGWIDGGGSSAFTSDGGATWVWDSIGASGNYATDSYLDNEHIWGGGANILLHYHRDGPSGVRDTSASQAFFPVSALRVYPNPTSGRLTTTVEMPFAGQAQLTLRDMTGRIRWTSEMRVAGGPATISMEEPHLPMGAYVLAGKLDGFAGSSFIPPRLVIVVR
jgi:photosystem II stability/assembly factor-like uncharacterized protein